MAVTHSVSAHHPGGTGNIGGAGPINTVSATTLPQGVSAAGVTYEYTSLSGLNDRDLIEAAERGEHAHSIATISSPAVSFAYGLTGDITLSVRLPYVIRTDIREGAHDHGGAHAGGHGAEVVRRGDADGFGDASALAQWRVLNNESSGTSAALLLGVKAPTGRTDQNDDHGERFEAEFQAGTGSWDGMFGLALTQRLGKWSLDGNVLYTSVSEGTQATDLGDRFHYNAAISYRVLGAAQSITHQHADGTIETHSQPASGPAVDLALELNGEWHDKQVIAGESDANSGGNVTYISPGVRVSVDKWSGFVSVGVPVINDLNGLQSEPDVRVTTGVGVSF
ncbi:MAG: transporter [Hyphomicrobium sp.]